MPGTTPYHNWPTMLDTDPMANVALAIRNLANAVDGGTAVLAAAAGWTSNSRYRLSAGIVTAYFDTVKPGGAWVANEPMSAALPVAVRPPVNAYVGLINRSTGAIVACYVHTDGTLRTMLAGGAAGQGILGVITYVL